MQSKNLSNFESILSERRECRPEQPDAKDPIFSTKVFQPTISRPRERQPQNRITIFPVFFCLSMICFCVISSREWKSIFENMKLLITRKTVFP